MKRTTLLLAALAACSCTVPNPWHCEATAPGDALVWRIETLQAFEHCPLGGEQVLAGVDLDRDGALGRDEIRRVLAVCARPETPRSQVLAADGPAGDICPRGGLELRAGLEEGSDDPLTSEDALSGLTTWRTEWLCRGALGAQGLVSLTRLAQLPPGDRCPEGGLWVASGLDLDGDLVLSTPEILQQADSCVSQTGEGPVAGPFSSLTVVDDAVGEACEAFGHGGQRVRTGLDDGQPGGEAHDGILDEAEVDTTAIICHGAQGPQGPLGPPGQSPAASLVRLEPELGGPVCPFSGTRVLTGLDLDADGVLQDAEITQEAVLCSSAPGTCAPDYLRELDERCVIACDAGNREDGQGACLAPEPCAPGFRDDGQGVCAPIVLAFEEIFYHPLDSPPAGSSLCDGAYLGQGPRAFQERTAWVMDSDWNSFWVPQPATVGLAAFEVDVFVPAGARSGEFGIYRTRPACNQSGSGVRVVIGAGGWCSAGTCLTVYGVPDGPMNLYAPGMNLFDRWVTLRFETDPAARTARFILDGQELYTFPDFTGFDGTFIKFNANRPCCSETTGVTWSDLRVYEARQVPANSP